MELTKPLIKDLNGMKFPASFSIALILCSLSFLFTGCFIHHKFLGNVTTPARELIDLNDSWKFKKGNPSDVQNPSFDDSDWETITLPHTWNNLDGQDGGNDYYRGISWYRKREFIPSDYANKKIFIWFGSANRKANLYVNGKHIGEHTGGYAAFTFDITDAITTGKENVIAVQVDNSATIDSPPLSADFTFCGGITRTAKLIITNRVHITPLDYGSPGVYITPSNITDKSAEVEIKSLIQNDNDASANPTISATILDDRGRVVNELSTTIEIPAGEQKNAVLKTTVLTPHLWNGRKDPYLYKVIVKVLVDGKEVDEITQPLGFRYFYVNPKDGFFLNGKYYRLQGVAFHEDRQDKGIAISDNDRKEDLNLLLDMGCTFLRLSHYQHGQYTYDYCDQNGIVLWTEIPLINYISSSNEFTSNCQQQLVELIRQNYNHPSVFFWGLFNEIDLKPGPNPTSLIQQLNILAHSEDPIRLTTAATLLNEKPINWIPDVLSWNKYMGWYVGNYNDFAGWIDNLHTSHPDTKIGVSEYGCGASIKHHKENPEKVVHNGPWHPEEYQNLVHEAHWEAIKDRPYLWSTALWVGFDFASDGRAEGDVRGINDKGIITRDRKTLKDVHYYYKANWSAEPVLYISSRRFTERTNSLVEVKVYSNCDSVELLVNNSSYGTLTSDDRIFKWTNVKLGLGRNEIKVKGVIRNKVMLDSCIWNYIGSETKQEKKMGRR